MYKVFFYYYNQSPRIHISTVFEMSYLPQIGDTVSFCKNDFFAINKDIIKKHYSLQFKVCNRDIIIKKGAYNYLDIRIYLELITTLKIK